MKQLIEFVYEKNLGRGRRGLVLAYKQNDVVYIGWSMCNKKMGDKFNNGSAIFNALKKAKPIFAEDRSAVPHLIRPKFDKMVSRAARYFKVEQ